MSSLYISEYSSIGVSYGQGMQAPQEPRLAAQKVSYTGTAGASSALNANTRLIGLSSDGIFSYRITTAGTAAAVTDFRVPAGTILYFAVNGGEIISAITNT